MNSVNPIIIRNASGKSLVYKEYGEPSKVLVLTSAQEKKPQANEVSVKWLLAPVNPADINTIQGKYPSKPQLPAVPGNEGLGEIIEVGSGVTAFKPGDRVVPNGSNLGTWTSYATYASNQLLKIPQSIAAVEACMLNVNPCTAYRMLMDFVKLEPGDCVIQNGGNSAVGQFVIQLCRIWKLKSVNIVRDRPDIDKLKSELTQLGATWVLTEQEFRKTDLFKSGKAEKPLLGLNCIGGQNALDLLRQIGHGGTMVTYGGMSREPVTVPTSALIFKDLILRGFWMTAWTKENEKSQQRLDMIEHLGKLFESKELRAPPHKLVPLSKYHEAIEKTLKLDGKTGVKYILDIST
ncbi:enoyl-[acyl-carrier-protein] reductase, mitochondrial isoform X2 [Venturia canescens]|nr:enoyl-[acyl-carrier-protein] reductase, mitochondrial isoform X2 [Venturia canescens]